MKLKQTKLLSVLAVCLFFASCSQRLIDFTVISSKNVALKVDKAKGVRAKGKSMGFLMIGVNIKDAMDKALESAGPNYDLLIDGVVKQVSYPFYGGFSVEGTAISSKAMVAQLGKAGFEEWCKANNIFDPSTAAVTAAK